MISPSRLVVVVFPFVPVTASTSPLPHSQASSTSPQIRTPRSRIAFTSGRSVGTPGLSTAKSIRASTSSGSSPRMICRRPPQSAPAFSTSTMLFEASLSFVGATTTFSSSSFASNFSFPSYRNTSFAGMPSRSLAAPIPLMPAPKTRTRLVVSSIILHPFLFGY